MRRLMPNKIKTQMRIFKGITGMDLLFIVVTVALCVLFIFIGGPLWLKLVLMAISVAICGLLCISFNGSMKGRTFLKYAVLYIFQNKKYETLHIKEQLGVTCKDGYMHYGENIAAVVEIEGIDFLSLDDNAEHDEQSKRIAVLTNLFKNITNGKIVKQQKAVDYSDSIKKAKERIKFLEQKYLEFMEKDITDQENKQAEYVLKKLEVLNNQLHVLEEQQEFGSHSMDAYYLIIFENKNETSITLEDKADYALKVLSQVGLYSTRLKGKEIRAFLKNFFNDDIPAGEELLEKFSYAVGDVLEKTVHFKRNGKDYGIKCITKYKVYTDNAWGAEIFSIPDTKVVFNFTPYMSKDVETEINKTITELNTVIADPKQTERNRADFADRAVALEEVRDKFKYENDLILNAQLYIIFPIEKRKDVLKVLAAQRHTSSSCHFHTFNSYVECWPFVPMRNVYNESICQMPASQVAAMWPFVDASLRDADGIYIGFARTPIIYDIFKRTSSRKSSNVVIFGTLGAGKSFFLKLLILSLNCYGIKIYCFDPDNEYVFLCKFLGGEVINVAGIENGIINPLQPVPSLPPEDDSEQQMGEISSHKQFLEEFFRVVLPNMDAIAYELLNSLVSELYKQFNIVDGIDISEMQPSDFPTFDDLYSLCVNYENTAGHEIDEQYYHILTIFLMKFVGDGAYSRLWNGHTSFKISDTDFVNFSFRELIGNNNKIIANSQMMLLTMFVNQEIIKNREENLKIGFAKSKFLVIFDEAHNFIDATTPIALTFMTRMSKQCRKYYGSQITATQNVNDFLGTAEIIRSKTTALLNNANYSFLFNLAANDLTKIKEMYAAANNPLKQAESEFIMNAEQGDVLFFVDKQVRIQMHVACYDGDANYFLQEAEKGS